MDDHEVFPAGTADESYARRMAILGHWSNGAPVHLIVDGKGGRRVAPNLNGATWIPEGSK